MMISAKKRLLVFLIVISGFAYANCDPGQKIKDLEEIARKANLDEKEIVKKLPDPVKPLSKEKILEVKLRELANLRVRLSEKIEEITKLKHEYARDMQLITKEIQTEKQRNTIVTFEQAQQNQRIVQDLALLQKYRAYIDDIEMMTVKLSQGTLELEYLERDTQADLKLVKALPEKEITDLINNINRAINKYLPDAGKMVINIDPKKLPSQEQLWEELNQGK
ncbi:MAG: hypothetical protein NT116_05040 [Candidatus Parcubacteria bacterium]|nr:hypothetical protein [Candidatus Parcubacteria bacterium]